MKAKKKAMIRKSRKMSPLKRGFMIAGIAFGVIALVLIGYVSYFLISFGRIEDHYKLTVGRNSDFDASKTVKTGETYGIMSYNIGFGAYSYDFDFFMDGGTKSWAASEDAVYRNINGSFDKVKSKDPEFLFLQEVDENSTRTYHINELEFVNLLLKPYNFTYAYNYYHSPYIFYPILEPHGTITSGLATYSKFSVESAERRSLPISESISKVVDLDRCYSISKVPMENGKYLVLFNVHLSAYGSDDSVREGQTSMLFGDMKAEYDAGNYVICGGDFNHDLITEEGQPGYSTWACPFPRSVIPEHFSLAMDLLGEENKNKLQMTCRDCNEPYTRGHTNEFIVDGFIVSDNVSVLDYKNLNTGYIYSDHEPVHMKFKLD